MELYWLVILPVIVGLIVYLLPLKAGKNIIVLTQIIQLGMAFYLLNIVRNTGTVTSNLGNWPELVGITLKADQLAAVMVILNCLIFLMAGIYNYNSAQLDRMFLFLFLALEGVISGIFLSNDLFNIFVLVEISVVMVSVLIMFKRDAQAIYDGIIYLLTNTVSMTMFLFGLAFLYKITGTVDMDGIANAISSISNPRALIVPYGLMITAASLKSALMPLFSWLPKAHGTPSAPSAVSAVLSGIYIKTGVYLFIRLQDIFSSQINSSNFFLILSFMTALIGFIFVLLQDDIKLVLAYSTVSQIGIIMVGINLNQDIAYTGAIYHIVCHGIFKATLFLSSGIIVEEYKTRNINEIKGVFKRMPVVAVASLFAVLGIIGTPLFSGSVSKYWIAYGAKGTWIEYGLLILNLGTVLAFIKYIKIFWSKENSKKVKIKKNQIFSVVIGGILCLLGGIFALPVTKILLNETMNISISGYLEKTIVFFITVIIGILIYRVVLSRLKLNHIGAYLELSFNEICLAMFLFMFSVMVYVDFKL